MSKHTATITRSNNASDVRSSRITAETNINSLFTLKSFSEMSRVAESCKVINMAKETLKRYDERTQLQSKKMLMKKSFRRIFRDVKGCRENFDVRVLEKFHASMMKSIISHMHA